MLNPVFEILDFLLLEVAGRGHLQIRVFARDRLQKQALMRLIGVYQRSTITTAADSMDLIENQPAFAHSSSLGVTRPATMGKDGADARLEVMQQHGCSWLVRVC